MRYPAGILMNHLLPGGLRETLIAALLLILISGCKTPGADVGRGPSTESLPTSVSAEKKLERPPQLPKDVAVGLQPAMDILQSDAAVESYRIDPVRVADVLQGILGYPVIARGPQLNKAAARQLKSLVLDPRGYNGEVWCGAIEPGVAFRILSGERDFTILVCFKCKEWEFWLNGERLGKGYFVGLQPELLKLVQQVFPDDNVLRAIAPSETYGGIYSIDSLRGKRHTLSDEQRGEMIAGWKERIRTTVGDPAGWRDAGGGKHSLRTTEDGRGLIVITTSNGHAAIELLDGIRPVTSGE
jgi:hypothetical protein